MSGVGIGGERGHVALPQMEQPREARAASQALPEANAEPSPFAKVLERAGQEFDRAEARAAAIHSPGAHERSPLELLALQADVHRYSELVGLTAKIVDGIGSAVKTVMGKGDG